MAAVTGGPERVGTVKASLKERVVERLARAVAGDRLDQLHERLDDMQAEIQECRQLNLRLAEVTDLVEQLLLPMSARDEEKIAEAVEKYSRTI